MANPDNPVCRGLDELITELTNRRPNPRTPQGGLDYRTLLLTQNARALLDLPELNPDAAVFLYHLVVERLRELYHLKLITVAQAKALADELIALYDKYRPELLPRVRDTMPTP